MTPTTLVEQLYLTETLKEDPIRIDTALLSFSPQLLSLLAEAFEPILSGLHFDCLYPADLFSVPLATHLSSRYHKPLFLPSPSNVFIQAGHTVLVLDVSSSLSPALKTSIEELRTQGLQICDLLVLLQAEEKASEVASCRLNLHSLWNQQALEQAVKLFVHQNDYSEITGSDIS